MVKCGSLCLILAQAPKKPLIFFLLIFSLLCFAFCIISLVYLLGEAIVNVNRLQSCWFDSVDNSCTCYTKEESDIRKFRFTKVANCEVITGELKQLLYGVTITFFIGGIISLIAFITAAILLCRSQYTNNVTESDSNQSHSARNVRTNETQTEEFSFISPVGDNSSSFYHDSQHSTKKKVSKNPKRCRSYERKRDQNEVIIDTFQPLFSEASRSSEIDPETASLQFISYSPPTYDDAIRRNANI